MFTQLGRTRGQPTSFATSATPNEMTLSRTQKKLAEIATLAGAHLNRALSSAT